jgi:hypothetical protein
LSLDVLDIVLIAAGAVIGVTALAILRLKTERGKKEQTKTIQENREDLLSNWKTVIKK